MSTTSPGPGPLKRLDPRQLQAYGNHLDGIATVGGERVCRKCGVFLGYVSSSRGVGAEGHNSFANEPHRFLRTNPIPTPGKGAMISAAAVVTAEFGGGVGGRLIRKALASLEELSRSRSREELPQEITTQLALLAEAECTKRAKVVTQAETEEGKEAVISACLAGMEKFPQYEPALRRPISEATSYFPDLTVSATKPNKTKKASLLDEEERALWAEEKEEDRFRSPGSSLEG